MRILVAVDDSAHNELALRLGGQVAGRVGEALTVLAVIKRAADRPLADAILEGAQGVLGSCGPEPQTSVRIGVTAVEIVREAREGGYDLLIVGEGPERNGLRRFLVGSTALRVVRQAPCSVLVAKGRIGPLHRILLCDSGASNPSLLSQFTRRLGALMKGDEEVTVLHVMSQISAAPGIRGAQLRADVKELIAEGAPEGEFLERDVRTLAQVGINSHPKVRHGLVVDEILQDVQSENYDLVVIGAHRGETWQRILLDDLSRKILTRLDRPVLVVR